MSEGPGPEPSAEVHTVTPRDARPEGSGACALELSGSLPRSALEVCFRTHRVEKSRISSYLSPSGRTPPINGPLTTGQDQE